MTENPGGVYVCSETAKCRRAVAGGRGLQLAGTLKGLGPGCHLWEAPCPQSPCLLQWWWCLTVDWRTGLCPRQGCMCGTVSTAPLPPALSKGGH